MPRRREADLGRRNHSNVRLAESRINRTDDHRAMDNDSSRIGMSESYLRVDVSIYFVDYYVLF